MSASLSYSFGIVLFAFSWIAYDHYRPWVNFHSEALALAGIWLLLFSHRANLSNRVTLIPCSALFLLAVAVLPWIQFFSGVALFAGDALVSSMYLFALVAAVWLGYSYQQISPKSTNEIIAFFYVLWFVALISAAIGLLQWLNLQGPLTVYVVQTDAGERAMGNLGQPNQLATLLLMGIICLAWTYERKYIGGFGLIVGVAFMTMGLVFAQSRAGMMSAAVAGIFMIWKSHSIRVRIAPWHLLFWLLAYAAAVLLLPLLSEILLMGESRSMNPEVDSARLTIWRQILSGIAQSPWVGYGWNQTPTAHAAGSLAVPGSLTFTNAHNIVLDILAWNGVPLGLLLTGACSYWFVSRMKGAVQSNAVYAMACLLPIAVHSMVEFPFAYAYFLLAAGVMVGIVEACHVGIKTFRVSLRWMGTILAVWFVLGSYMVYEYFLIEDDSRIVRFENLRLGQTPAEYKVPDIWMLSHMGAMLKAARQQALPGMSADDLENLRKVSLRFSYGSLHLRYALALGLNGNASGATQQMVVIRSMYGEAYYQAAVSVLRGLQQEKYPELARVITP
jgi:O-antigen ligase